MMKLSVLVEVLFCCADGRERLGESCMLSKWVIALIMRYL